jgi:hypothetical protein
MIASLTAGTIIPASQTRDARQLFRIWKGLSRKLVNSGQEKRLESLIDILQ